MTMTALELIWGIVQAALLPSVLLMLVANARSHDLREVIGFGGLIVLAAVNSYPLLAGMLAGMQHGRALASAYWLGFDAPGFYLMGLLFAIGIITRRLRAERAKRNGAKV
jgi:hypothetical protein